MAGVFEAIIYANDLQGAVYAEPFAGGAGAGLKLLEAGHVDRIIINDADRAIFCFWWSVMHRSEEFVDRILTTQLSIREWQAQREIYQNKRRGRRLDLGFAAFYLNRCNRSGIIKNGGPIGGVHQSGEWKIDARFNRQTLASRVQEISAFGERVTVLQVDAQYFVENIETYTGGQPTFVYADPPYYLKGRELYLNHYADEDHRAFAEAIQRQANLRWVMTYDNAPRIRELYGRANLLPFTLRYSAHHSSTEGSELLISPPGIVIPQLAKDRLSRGGFFREQVA